MSEISTVNYINPNDVAIPQAGDILYDPRGDKKPNKEFIANITTYGVRTPISVIYRDNVPYVQAGRRRVLAAREAGLKEIPYIVSNDVEERDLLAGVILENENRLADNPVAKARKAQAMIDVGASKNEVAIAFGVSAKFIGSLLSLLKMSDAVQKAIEKEQVAMDVALEWKDMSHPAQDKELKKALEGAKAKGKDKVTKGTLEFVLGESKMGARQLKAVSEYAQTPPQMKALFRIILGKATDSDKELLNTKFGFLEVLDDNVSSNVVEDDNDE